MRNHSTSEVILCFLWISTSNTYHAFNQWTSLSCSYTVRSLGRRVLIKKTFHHFTLFISLYVSSELWDDKRAFNSRSQPTKVQIIFYIWNPWHLCVTLKEEIYVLFLEVPAGDEPGQWLMLPLPLPVRLPPVGIVRADHMENVALHEGDAQLSTGNVYVLLWIVVKQGFYMNLGTKENKTLSKYKSCCVLNEAEIGIKFWAW